jgi:hypothetical protein
MRMPLLRIAKRGSNEAVRGKLTPLTAPKAINEKPKGPTLSDLAERLLFVPKLERAMLACQSQASKG